MYLADYYGSLKPTFLPLDNPADFSFFFDTGGRRRCYLAPEVWMPFLLCFTNSPGFGLVNCGKVKILWLLTANS